MDSDTDPSFIYYSETSISLTFYHLETGVTYPLTHRIEILLIVMQQFLFVIQQIKEVDYNVQDSNFLWKNLYEFKSAMEHLQLIIEK